MALRREEVLDWLIALFISGFIMLIGNTIGYEVGFMEGIPGILWLVLFSLIGMIIKNLIPVDLPAAAYISLVAIIFASPISPLASNVIESVEKISLLATCTPILAYAGVSIGRDWPLFKKIGYKGIIVSLLVIMGTVLMCVLIAEVLFGVFGG